MSRWNRSQGKNFGKNGVRIQNTIINANLNQGGLRANVLWNGQVLQWIITQSRKHCVPYFFLFIVFKIPRWNLRSSKLLNFFHCLFVACICITTKTWRHHPWADREDKTGCESSWQHELPQNQEDSSEWPHRRYEWRRKLCGWKWWWWWQVRSSELFLLDLQTLFFWIHL